MKRHPAEVTADRLADHVEKYYDLMDGVERDAFARAIWVLNEIGDGTRKPDA